MSPQPLPLILLKTKSSPSDPYDTYFRTHPLLSDRPTNPIFVPVLQHRQTNLSQLRDILTNGGVDGRPDGNAEYSALIITSQRSVEALGGVLERLKGEGGFDLTPLLEHTLVFVVGPATATAVTGLGFRASNVLGGECGNGAVLGPFILDKLRQQVTNRAPKLLFLVGETRRDVIQKTLKEAGVGFTELVVYETTVVESFRADLLKVLEETETTVTAENKSSRGERWVAVFSPQGADVAVKALRDKDVWGRTLVAAIGPTTEQRLAELGRKPDSVARQPSPEGLWEVVKEQVEKMKTG